MLTISHELPNTEVDTNRPRRQGFCAKVSDNALLGGYLDDALIAGSELCLNASISTHRLPGRDAKTPGQR